MVANYISVFLAAVLLAFVQASNLKAMPTCNAAYTCKTSSQTFASGTCSFFSNTGSIPTYYASKCTKIAANYCWPATGANSTCIGSNPPTTGYGWPGEKCTKSTDCSSHASKGCINGICQGAAQYENCTTNDDCNPGFYCAPGVNQCFNQIRVGGAGCRDDFDCVNQAGCYIYSNTPNNTANNVCFPYFSISDHYPMGTACEDNISYLCSSGRCMFSNNGVYECLSKVKSVTLPMPCNSMSDCLAQPDTYFPNRLQGRCACAYANATQSYCTLNPGDQQVVNTLTYLKNWLQSAAVDSCNTNRRFDLSCISQMWTKKSYNQYILALLTEIYYPQLVNSQSCVQEVYFPDYFAALNA